MSATSPPPPPPPPLSSYTFPVRTASAACQAWFDRGCMWAYGLHKHEALHCFQNAEACDPKCAMACWGIAYANCPDYNFNEPQGFFEVVKQTSGFPSFLVAHEALARARANLDGASPAREAALVRCLALLVEWPIVETTAARRAPFAEAMEALASEQADDADLQALCAEAVMNLAPWQLWEADRKTPTAIARRASAVLDRGLAVAPTHPFLCHLKVHHDEMGPVSAFDWAAAEALRENAAAVGHLLHMPTHLDIQVGDYARAISCNEIAIEADLALHAADASRFAIYLGYVTHNMEFAAWAAMYAGCRARALAAAAAIDALLTEEVLRANPINPVFNEVYRSDRLMVLTRFGEWDAILATPLPADEALYASTTAVLHWARAIALGVRGELAAAREAQARFADARGRLQPGDRRKHNVDVAAHMLPIAAAVLAGELAYREGAHEEAFGALEQAVALYDALPYDEPAGYLMSPRQTIGALLLEQGHAARARAYYEEDLALFPKNVWSLAGLASCLEATQRTAEEERQLLEVSDALAKARAFADMRIGASCACARGFAA